MNDSRSAIDWQGVGEQASELLSRYIRIDTTNPPGGEEAGALFLRDELAREGIGSKLYDAGDGRVSLAARLDSDSGVTREGKPLVLLSHIDVVPAEEEYWKVPPFSGTVADGYVWGRGALDIKGMAIMELLAMVLIKRHRLPLSRDLVFVSVADEEEGGLKGVRYLHEVAPELLDAEYVFNEGAYGFSQFMGQDTKLFGVCSSEKSPCWVKLVVRGEPGHASVPRADNALVKLVRALARVEERQKVVRLTDPVEAMLATLKRRGFLPGELDHRDPAVVEALASADAHLYALSHDTVTITGAHAGHKHNVIPAKAEATLDCRLLPGTETEDFVDELRRIIDDPEIEIVRVLEHNSGQSSMDTPAVRAIAEVISERYGDEADVLPMLSPGFTDSHAFRKAGAHAYGFTPVLLTREELGTIHGHNERISLENLRLGTEILFDVIGRLCGAGAGR